MFLTCRLSYGIGMWIEGAPHMVCPHAFLHMLWCMYPQGFEHEDTLLATMRTHDFEHLTQEGGKILLMVTSVRTRVNQHEDELFLTMRTHDFEHLTKGLEKSSSWLQS